MIHDELKILISCYADGEVTPVEKQIVEEHLLTCTECQKDLAAYQKLSSSLKVWPEERLSPDVEMNIARKSATKERGMEHRETTIQWGAVLTLIAIFSFSVLSVQMYAKRGLQGRLRSSSDDIGDQSSPANARIVSKNSFGKLQGAGMFSAGTKSKEALGTTAQYEPYYLETNYEVQRKTEEQSKIGQLAAVSDVRNRAGAQMAVYDQGLAAPVAAAPASQTMQMLRFEGARKDVYPVESDRAYPLAEQEEGYDYYQPGYRTNTESYDQSAENAFLTPLQQPLSTFSIDVDTASYSNIRRFLNRGQLPPQDAVRIEEIINYFSYDYPEPMWGQPFSITTEVAPCPWNPSHQLALIGLQGKRLNSMTMPASNLVFLIDVSGSMSDANKLPLLQDAFRMMTQELEGKDKVSIVVYAGAAGLVLDAAPGNSKERILAAIDQLRAGGSTAGGAGIQLAYQVARNNFIANGNNRVILATDGDFNVGISRDDDLVRLIENNRDQGIFLTVLGFGEGNLKDSKMEKLADKGNGNYFYIDTQNEARKVLVNELGSTLFTIAKDVKIQVEFNPATVQSYRLIGYENRLLAKEDFNDDTKDAGELGAGHTVTALYEIIPADSYETHSGQVDPLRYQKNPQIIRGNSSDIMTVKLRYKDPKGTTSKLMKKAVGKNEVEAYPKSDNLRMASAAAEFGLLLRQSPYRGSASFEHVLGQIRSLKMDEFGYRWEFSDLVEKARQLSPYLTPIPVEDTPVYQPYYGTPAHGKSQK